MRADNSQNTFRNYGDYVSGTHVWSWIEFTRSLLMVSIHIAACYIFIYYLVPRFLLKNKFFFFLAGASMLVSAMIIASLFMDSVIIPALFFQSIQQKIAFYSSIFSGVVNAIIIIAAASILKFGKNWWQKQKEKELLEREKINTELQLLKAQIRPGFLFNSLNNIYNFSVTASPCASESLLKLSGLLSYMLYECDQLLVPVEKEIEMMKDYIAMEKIRLGEATEIELSVTGDLNGKMIAPFLLLPFIENSLNHHRHLKEDHWINLDISIAKNYFDMKLANNIRPEAHDGQHVLSDSLINVQKRLTLLYPQKHELKISNLPEMQIVLLKIQISEDPIVESGQHERNADSTLSSPTQANIYVAQ